MHYLNQILILVEDSPKDIVYNAQQRKYAYVNLLGEEIKV